MADKRTEPIVFADPYNLTLHPVTDCFPRMTEQERAGLLVSIEDDGQHDAIWITPDNEIIDGVERALVCHQRGRQVEARVFHG